MSNTPANAIPYVPQNTLDPAAGLNLALAVIDALLNTRVENMTTNAPPGSPANGVCYIVGGAPTGAWAGHANALATYVADGAFWTFYEAGAQAWLIINKADGNLYKWNPATPAWEQAAGIGEAPLDGGYYGRLNGAWAAMPDVINMVTSVNGRGPDTSGDVRLDIPPGGVASVNGETPDTSGNVVIQLGVLDGINEQVGTAYSLELDDVGKAVRVTNAAAITATIPANATTAFPVGCLIPIYQGGAGAVTLAPAAGVTFEAPFGLATAAAGDYRMAFKRDVDTWVIS